MPLSYLQQSQVLIGVFVTIAGFEWHWLCAKGNLNSFFDKDASMLRLQDRGWTFQFSKGYLRFFAKTRSVARSLAFIQVILGLILISSPLLPDVYWLWMIPLLALICHLTFASSYAFGLEGADQMASIVLCSLSLALAFPQSEQIVQIFITAQIILSYTVSGVAKAISKSWLSGSAIKKILSTKSFGFGYKTSLADNEKLAQVASLLTIFFEIAWIGIPFSEFYTFTMMSFGIIFHIAVSYVMGLNLFLWSFAAAYPWAYHLISALHNS